jgi:hypothetical protein
MKKIQILAMNRWISRWMCAPILCVSIYVNRWNNQILAILCLDYLTCLEFYFDVLLNMLQFYFEVLLNMLEYARIMSRLSYMSKILF